MKKFIKNYLNFSSRERVGVLTLLILCILLKAFPYFLPAPEPYIPENDMLELKAMLKEAEKPETAEDYEDKEEIRPVKTSHPKTKQPFDPNTISVEEWIQLGIHKKIAERINKYLASGARFRKAEDLLKIYGFPRKFLLSHTALLRFEPYPTINKKQPAKEIQTEATELNSADSATLERLPGLGAYSIRKILKYREILGGFASIDQLLEIKNISAENFEKFKVKLSVNQSLLRKIKVNSLSAMELSRHPYLKKHQAEALCSFRKEHGSFKSIEDLRRLPVFSNEDIDRLKPYLSFN